ncbi:MAG: hypothetical protein DIU80_004880 [Chloroflexota bacterium]|nr:MAG: hypothetical protein DIU80_13640 [Chloroflexota bacterium]
MNLDKRQPAAVGIFLIALGLVWWLDLWWLLWPGALIVGGAVAYIQRRAAGRVVEAVQAGLWGVGLGLLFLISFFWPGLLFLAGVSVLLRGREDQVDDRVQQLLGRMKQRGALRPVRSQQVPVTTYQPQAEQPEVARPPAVGETTRLP